MKAQKKAVTPHFKPIEKKVAQPTAKPLTKADKDFIAKNRGMNASELSAALGRPVEEMRQLVEMTVEKSSMVRFYAAERGGETATPKKEPGPQGPQQRIDQRDNGGRRLPTQRADHALDFTVYDDENKGMKRIHAQKGSGRSYDGSRERSLAWRRMIENGGK
jgi:hypothetical protein